MQPTFNIGTLERDCSTLWWTDKRETRGQILKNLEVFTYFLLKYDNTIYFYLLQLKICLEYASRYVYYGALWISSR